MFKSSLVVSTLIATTIFISPHSLLAGQEETSGTPVTTASTPAKLSIEDQLGRDYVNLSMELMKWDHDQKEKTATAVPVAVPGLEPDTRQKAALRILLDMHDKDGYNPVELAVMNNNAAFTGLFLAALGEEANSPKLSGLPLLHRATKASYPSPENLDEAVVETIIALRESEYKFDYSQICNFPRFKESPFSSQIYYDSYQCNRHIALAILLGADKSNITYYTGTQYPHLVDALVNHYITLSKNGLAHLVDIDSSFETPLEEKLKEEKLNLDELKKQSAEVRQKKSQLQQLAEATARLNLK